MSTKVKFAIQALNPSAKFRVLDDSVDIIEWLYGTTPISKSNIEAKIAEQQTAYDNDYVRKRMEAYNISNNWYVAPHKPYSRLDKCIEINEGKYVLDFN